MKLGTTIGCVAALAMLAGCSVHSQAPIKQVAYDFSEYDYYDHPHAISPNYGAASQGYADEAEGESAIAKDSGERVASLDAAAPNGADNVPASSTFVPAGPVPVTPVRHVRVVPPPIAPSPVVARAPQPAPVPEVTPPSPRGAGPEIQVYDARVYPTYGYPVLGLGYARRARTDVVTHTERHTDYVEHHEHHEAVVAPGF